MAATQSLGYSYLFTDEVDEAERLLNGVLPIIERVGGHEVLARHWLGMSWRPGLRAEAERLFELAERTVSTAREVGEPVTEAFAHMWMGQLETLQGPPEAALARLRESEARAWRAGQLWLSPLPR